MTLDLPDAIVRTWRSASRLRLLPVLLYGTIMPGCFTDEVENRRQETVRRLTSNRSSEEMVTYLRKELSSATSESLQHPELLFARVYFFPGDDAGNEPDVDAATEMEIVFFWLEDPITVRGLTVFSRKTGVKCGLRMDSEQLDLVSKEAESSVSHSQAFRFRVDSSGGDKVLEMLSAGDAQAILTGQDATEVGEPVRLSRQGDPF